MEREHRFLAITILVVLLFALNFAVAAVDYRPYPDQRDIVSEPAAYDTEQVFVFREVQTVSETDSRAVVLRESSPIVSVASDGITRRTEYREEVIVDYSDATVAGEIGEGSAIQVYGQLRDETTVIDADRVVVDYQDAADYTYTYGVSIVGLIVAVTYFFKNWRIDGHAGCFAPRGER